MFAVRGAAFFLIMFHHWFGPKVLSLLIVLGVLQQSRAEQFNVVAVSNTFPAQIGLPIITRFALKGLNDRSEVAYETLQPETGTFSDRVVRSWLYDGRERTLLGLNSLFSPAFGFSTNALRLGPNGHVTFRGGDFRNAGLYQGLKDSLAETADVGQQVDPTNVLDTYEPMAVDETGRALLTGRLKSTTTGLTTGALVYASAGGLEKLIAVGDPIAGTGRNLQEINVTVDTPQLGFPRYQQVGSSKENGFYTFAARLEYQGGSIPETYVLIRAHNQEMHLVAQGGKPAPGTDLLLSRLNFLPPVVNSSGHVAFYAELFRPGEFGGTGLFLSNENGLQNLVFPGQQAPGRQPGVTFGSIHNLKINDRGDIAFSASLVGPGMDDTSSGVWVWKDGTLMEVIRAGFTEPLVYGQMLDWNDRGQIIFRGSLQNSLSGLFAYDPVLGITPLITNHYPFEIRLGEFARLENFQEGGLIRDARLNDLGQVVAVVSTRLLNDGNALDAILITAIPIPEPATWATAVIALFAILAIRRQRLRRL